jgi:hypothetical protein
MALDRTIIVSALLLCNYLLEFNETLWEGSISRWESSISRGDAHIIGLFRSDPLTRELWPLISVRSDTITQRYGLWLIMQYAYRVIIVSVLLLCNYWLEFNKTLLEPSISRWESSISRGDARIIGLFWSDSLTQELWHLISMHIEQ